MKRVTRTGGWILALAEPDYGGRVDYPNRLSVIGDWQREALQNQGADPTIGRKLLHLFTNIDLKNIQVGVLGGEWGTGWNLADQKMEWEVLEQDFLSLNSRFDERQVEEIRRIEIQAYESGTRLTYVPTFYAFGQVL